MTMMTMMTMMVLFECFCMDHSKGTMQIVGLDDTHTR